MIKDLKELQALLKLCRKQGVTSITLGDVSINFGELPVKSNEPEEGDGEVQADGLTPEQLMFFSVGGAPP